MSIYKKESARKYYLDNRDIRLEQSKTYAIAHKKQIRFYKLKYKYGITESEYEIIRKNQNNKCGICKIELDEIKCCVDHDHKTGMVRGLLCDRCNTGIGRFEDDVYLLIKATKYLMVSWFSITRLRLLFVRHKVERILS
jgi:hypothetical protein